MFRLSYHPTISLSSHRWFTLIELMIAMSIFAVMSVMIMNVYINTTNTSRKLNMTRELSETAREITERISQDIRDKGIDMDRSKFDDTMIDNELWRSPNYTQSGWEILAIADGVTQYFYAKKQWTTLSRCTTSDKEDKKVHCWLYLIRWQDWSSAYNLVDSFIPEEDKKRVKIENLRFYISWDDFTTKKVTLVMTLALMPRIGVPASMVENTKLHIQTTMSERGWKREQ
jgi:prepilin-type N-terminal cleavage/methylation domain-containing protein